MDYTTINHFWFSEEAQPLWFNSTAEFDRQIRQQFETIWLQGQEGGLHHWESHVDGILALVLLYDQFPLNMYRGKPMSFATEALARKCAAIALKQQWDQLLEPKKRSFLYLPYMHSESTQDQDLSVELFSSPEMENNLRWAKHHRDLIYRFGRFPHRNEILGRTSTEEELQYLASKSAFHG